MSKARGLSAAAERDEDDGGGGEAGSGGGERTGHRGAGRARGVRKDGTSDPNRRLRRRGRSTRATGAHAQRQRTSWGRGFRSRCAVPPIRRSARAGTAASSRPHQQRSATMSVGVGATLSRQREMSERARRRRRRSRRFVRARSSPTSSSEPGASSDLNDHRARTVVAAGAARAGATRVDRLACRAAAGQRRDAGGGGGVGRRRAARDASPRRPRQGARALRRAAASCPSSARAARTRLRAAAPSCRAPSGRTARRSLAQPSTTAE